MKNIGKLLNVLSVYKVVLELLFMNVIFSAGGVVAMLSLYPMINIRKSRLCKKFGTLG